MVLERNANGIGGSELWNTVSLPPPGEQSAMEDFADEKANGFCLEVLRSLDSLPSRRQKQ